MPEQRRRTLVDRIDAFQRRNPSIRIAPWYATFSKLWEVTGPGSGTTQYDNGYRMMDFLEQRYPDASN